MLFIQSKTIHSKIPWTLQNTSNKILLSEPVLVLRRGCSISIIFTYLIFIFWISYYWELCGCLTIYIIINDYSSFYRVIGNILNMQAAYTTRNNTKHYTVQIRILCCHVYCKIESMCQFPLPWKRLLIYACFRKRKTK